LSQQLARSSKVPVQGSKLTPAVPLAYPNDRLDTGIALSTDTN